MSPARRESRRLLPLAPALVVTLTAVFALPHQAGGFRLSKWSAFHLALGAISAACLWASVPLRTPRRWHALGAFVLSALALPAASPALSPTHWPSALGLVGGVAFFFVTVMMLDDDETARRASLVVLTGGGTSCAALVLLQAAGLRWLTSDVYTGLEFRAPGTFGNPNWAAAYLAPLVPLSLGLAATAPRRWPHYCAAGVLAIATVATWSKGGVATLAAGSFVFLILGCGVSKRRRAALVVGTSALALGALAIAWRSGSFAEAPWLRGRLFLWRAALFVVGEHPLTGVGLGGYPAAYGRAAAALLEENAAAFMPLSSVDFTHQDLLQFAAEGGILSTAAFVVVVGGALASAHQRGDPSSRGVGAAAAALVVNGLADSPLRVPSTFVLFFFLLGWLSPSASSPNRPRLLLLAIALLGAFQGVRLAAGNAYWTRGRAELAAGEPAVRNLERARRWMPEHGRSASQYARALAREGRFEDALAASAAAASLRFDFDDEIARRDLASRTLAPSAALRQWQELSHRFPFLITPHLRLGALHLRVGNLRAAIAAYETALENPQSTPRAEAARAQARRILGSLTAARRQSSTQAHGSD